MELNYDWAFIFIFLLSECYLRNIFERMKRLRPLFPVCAQKDLPAQSSFTATNPQLLKTTSIRNAGQVLPLLPKLRIHQWPTSFLTDKSCSSWYGMHIQTNSKCYHHAKWLAFHPPGASVSDPPIARVKLVKQGNVMPAIICAGSLV